MTTVFTYIAFVLSVVNTFLWVVLFNVIRKVFKQMYPIYNSLTASQKFAIMDTPSLEGDINSK